MLLPPFSPLTRSVFAAVGSLHMIGAGGLPALMRQRGYVVEQVRFGR